MTSDRVLPNNIDAERAVLGALLMPDEGPAATREVLDMGLKTSHFYKEAHQLIFDAIHSLHKEDVPADLVIVTEKLMLTKHLARVGGAAYLNELIDSVPTAANVAYYANMVVEAFMRRTIIQQLSELAVKVDNQAIEFGEIIADIKKIDGSLPGLKKNWRRNKSVDAETFCQVVIEDIPMIVGGGLIPAFGYTMMAGYAKSGKTTLCMQLCLSIATGTPFLDTFPIEQPGAPVLYCYLENDDSGIQKILNEQRQAWGNPIHMGNLHLLEARQLCLQNDEDLSHLKSVIQEKQIKLCVIDPVSLAMRHDQNDYAVVRSLINNLKGLGQETGTAFLLIHHFHKPTVVKRDAVHAMIGSSAWGNFAESIIGIDKWSADKPQDYKRLTFVLRSAQAPEDICIFRGNKSLFELVDGPDQMTTARVRDVIKIMEEHGQPANFSLLTELIMTDMELAERQARRLITAAVESGFIQKEPGKRGKYSLPRKRVTDDLFGAQSQ